MACDENQFTWSRPCCANVNKMNTKLVNIAGPLLLVAIIEILLLNYLGKEFLKVKEIENNPGLCEGRIVQTSPPFRFSRFGMNYVLEYTVKTNDYIVQEYSASENIILYYKSMDSVIIKYSRVHPQYAFLAADDQHPQQVKVRFWFFESIAAIFFIVGLFSKRILLVIDLRRGKNEQSGKWQS